MIRSTIRNSSDTWTSILRGESLRVRSRWTKWMRSISLGLLGHFSMGRGWGRLAVTESSVGE